MSDDNSESRIAELEEKVGVMAEQMAEKDRQMAEKDRQMAEKDRQMTEKDRQMAKLADLYAAALKQIQDLTAELQEAKGIISAAVARSIGAKPDKKTGSTRRRAKGKGKGKGKPSDHKRTGLARPERIDAEETADPHMCGNCGSSDLSECVSTYTKVVREAAKTELKHIKVTVKRRRCRNCKRTVSGRTPLALPNSRYGINFMIMMVILRLHGMSDLRICNIVMMMYSARITESAINRMVCRMARELGPLYEKIREEVRNSPAINGDETIWRVDGTNYWLWVAVARYAVIYEVHRHRNSKVPKKMLGKDYPGCVTSDSWAAWNVIGSMHQKCHLHYARDIKDTLKYKNPGDDYKRHARTLRAILWDSHIDGAVPRGAEALAAKKRLDRRIASLIGRLEKDRDCKHCNRMCKRLVREKGHLFAFLETDGVEYHNNRAERAIRPCVILRKNSNGSRSKKGADAIATLMSIKQTCKARGDDLGTILREGLAPRQKTA